MTSRRIFDKANTSGKYTAQVFRIKEVLASRRPESYLLENLNQVPIFGQV